MTVAQDRRRRAKLDAAVARGFTSPILRVMRREEKRVLAATSPQAAIDAVKDSDWVSVLVTLWLSNPVNDVWKAQQKALGTEFKMPPAVRRQFTKIAGEHGRSIAEQRRRRVERIVRPEKAADRFDPNRTFRSTRRKQLQALYAAAPDQAASLAITEALQATETARYESARAAGEGAKLRLMKVWFTQGDGSVRSTHSAVNGQSRVVNHRGWGGRPGKFRVGNASLAHPREPGGPPGEVINCRCFLEYRRVRVKK